MEVTIQFPGIHADARPARIKTPLPDATWRTLVHVPMLSLARDPDSSQKNRLRKALAILACAVLGFAIDAWPAAFEVELDAPDETRVLLEKNLQIYREIANPDLTALRFRFLVQRTEEEIRSLLSTEGYFSATVTRRIDIRTDGGIAYLSVAPGTPSRVTGATLDLRGAISTQDKENDQRRRTLQRSLQNLVGTIFRNDAWEKSKQQILLDVRSKRYPAAQITDSEALVDPDTHTVTLHIAVDSGPVFTFGDVHIEGLDLLPRSLVSAVNHIKPGAHYDEQDLTELQSQLQRTNYFRSVFVTIPKDPAKPERVPIQVSVVENTSRRIGSGIGYSSDVGAGVEFRYEDNLTFRPGWRSRSVLKLAQREQSIATELYLVPILGGIQPRLDAQAKETTIQNDRTVSSLLAGRLLRQDFATEWSLSVELRNERKEIFGDLFSETASLPLNLSWTRRVLDNAIYPRKGFIANLQIGGALEQTISDQRFTRAYGKSTVYWPIGARGTLILRGEIGAVNADSRIGIPDDYLFRAGGSQSVRGYSYGQLGVAQNGAIVPGRYIGVASIEISHPVTPSWAGAVFFDRGNVVDAWKDFQAVNGYGIGARWRSPLGPLNLDLAYGEEFNNVQLHFSVGMTF